jgi:hypothetical protein
MAAWPPFRCHISVGCCGDGAFCESFYHVVRGLADCVEATKVSWSTTGCTRALQGGARCSDLELSIVAKRHSDQVRAHALKRILVSEHPQAVHRCLLCAGCRSALTPGPACCDTDGASDPGAARSCPRTRRGHGLGRIGQVTRRRGKRVRCDWHVVSGQC